MLFTALALAAQVAGVQSPRVLQGAEMFFWSRMVYVPVYYIGIPYLRTAVWAVGIAGLGMLAAALVC